jgi:hypothetical protein
MLAAAVFAAAFLLTLPYPPEPAFGRSFFSHFGNQAHPGRCLDDPGIRRDLPICDAIGYIAPQ